MRWTHVWQHRALLGLALGLLGLAPTELPEYREAQTVARTIIEETRGLLTRVIQEKGPVEALTQCSAVALALAQQHEQHGWRVRRVSLKVRNAADTPDAYEMEVLRQFAAMQAQGTSRPETEYVAVVGEPGTQMLRYLKPIVIAAPLCLQCHGTPAEISPAVQARLRELYPHDQATDYQMHELRGAVSVMIPLKGP